MEIASLIVRFFEALAWPITVLLIFFFTREQLLTMLRPIRRFKVGPVEAEFEREVEQITKLQPPPVIPRKAESRQGELIRIAQINPRSAILDAWLGVESSLKRAALQRFGGSSPPPDISSPVSLVS